MLRLLCTLRRSCRRQGMLQLLLSRQRGLLVFKLPLLRRLLLPTRLLLLLLLPVSLLRQRFLLLLLLLLLLLGRCAMLPALMRLRLLARVPTIMLL